MRSADLMNGDEGGLVRIGELARRSGVAPSTLRAWERRYEVVRPVRGASGYRLYSSRDEGRLRAMVELIEAGLAPAEAAQRLTGTDPAVSAAPPAGDPETVVAGWRPELRTALMDYDEGAADRLLDRAVSSLSIEALLSELILPVLHEIGEGWAREEVTVGQEHFASNMLRGRMLGLARGWGGGGGRLALLAAPSGEHHDLGLIAFGLALRSRGWRIALLGADTPLESLLDAAEQTDPAASVLCALDPRWFDGLELDLARLALLAPLHLAGPGVPDGLCERLGANRLREDPVRAAATLAG